MHTTLTGLEYGLVGYWTFDECAGGRLRCASFTQFELVTSALRAPPCLAVPLAPVNGVMP